MNRRTETVQTLQEVRTVYAKLGGIALERSCIARTECCQFHLTGLTPQLTRGEAILAAKALRATGRSSLPEFGDGACPLLKRETGRCLIYADRPFGCRTHFCDAAGGPYPRKSVLGLIRELEEIDRRLDGDGPHPIESAIQVALEDLS